MRIVYTCIIVLAMTNPTMSKKRAVNMRNPTSMNFSLTSGRRKTDQNFDNVSLNKTNGAISNSTFEFLPHMTGGERKAYNELAKRGYTNITLTPAIASNSTHLKVNVIHANTSSNMNDTLHDLGYKNVTLFPPPITTETTTESMSTEIYNNVTQAPRSISSGTAKKLMPHPTTYPSIISPASLTNESSPQNNVSQVNVTSTSTFNSPLGNESQTTTTSPISLPTTDIETESLITNYSVPRSYAITKSSDKLEVQQNETETLIYAWVIFSHGMTTPAAPYPSDPYTASQWHNQLNSLTETGKQQMHALGKWARQRYSKFCDFYDSRTITVLSEGTDNMLESAESFVAGLFPPIYSDSNANESLSWQPIPIHTVSSMEDLLMKITTSIDTCRQYQLEINQEEHLTEWTDLRNTYADAFNYTATHAGYQFTSTSIISDLSQMYDCNYDLITEQSSGLLLPSWTKKVYPEPLHTLALKYLLSLTGTPTLQKLKAGPGIAAFIEEMKNKVAGHLTENLHILSANDVCLVSLMNSLGIKQSTVPMFASVLMMELHKKNDEFIVMISLKNSTNEPYLLTIPNCQADCSFHEFVRLTQWIIPSNWEDECSVITIGNLTWSTPLLVAGLVVIIVLIFLTVLMMIKFCRCFNKKTARINSGR